MLNTAYSLYILAVIFAPTALGSTSLMAALIVESSIFAALFLVLVHAYYSQTPFRIVPALWPALAYLCWVGLQLVPLPSAVLSWLSPNTYAIYAAVHLAPDTSFWAPISIKPQYTVQEFFRFAAFIAAYILTIQLVWQRKRLQQTLNILFAVIGILAFLAIIQCFAGNGKIFWFVDPGRDAFFGSFFYRNHYAGFMAMLLPLCTAIFLYYRPQAGTGIPVRQQIVHILDQLKNSPSFRYGLIALIIFASILLSQSRTGISVAIITTGSMLLWTRKLFRLNRSSRALMLLMVLLAVLVVGRTGFDRIDVRFGEAVNESGLSENGRTLSGRTTPWQDCLNLFADFPLTGTGMGTFYAIYPSYKTIESQNPLRQAHNEYVETATDGGLIACAIIACFLFLFARQNFGMYRLRRDSYAKHLYIGSVTGLLALLLHSITDYQFHQTAANPLYFFVLLGILTVAIHSRRTTSENSSLLPQVSCNKLTLISAQVLLILLIVLTTIFNGGAMKALTLYESRESAGKALPDASQEIAKEDLVKRRSLALLAASYDPLNPIYQTEAAYFAQRLDLLDEADNEYRRVLSIDPINADTLQLYGVFLSGIEGGDEGAVRMFEASVQRDKNSKNRLLVYCYWLLGQNKIEQGVAVAQTMLSQYPELAPSFLASLQAGPIPPELVRQLLPERVAPYVAYAALLEKKGEVDQAAAIYDVALSYIEREETVKSTFFTQPLAFFRKQKNEDRVLAVLKMAVTRLPNEYSFHLQLGDAYVKQGMHRMATDAYRMALQIKPGDRSVQQRLESVRDE